jgi:hypothetical protein
MEYETQLMNKEQFEEFTEFFDAYVGTDYEVNEDPAGSDKVYCVCFELNPSEVVMIREFENKGMKVM